jgi:hypothetical protein
LKAYETPTFLNKEEIQALIFFSFFKSICLKACIRFYICQFYLLVQYSPLFLSSPFSLLIFSTSSLFIIQLLVHSIFAFNTLNLSILLQFLTIATFSSSTDLYLYTLKSCLLTALTLHIPFFTSLHLSSFFSPLLPALFSLHMLKFLG